MRKEILLIMIMLALLTACSQGGTDEKIKIGVIAPLSGNAANFGRTQLNVINMVVSEINSAGGINGKQLEIIAEDGKCNGKDAVSAAQKLVNIDGVKVILGGSCSGETLAAATVTQPARVLLFSSLSSHPDIGNAGDLVFRNSPSDADGGIVVAEKLISDGHKKVAIISENTDYAQAIKKVFIKKIESLGGKIVANENFNSDEKDLRSQFAKIKSANPDAVFINPQSDTTAILLGKQYIEQGIDASLYGYFFFSNQETISKSGIKDMVELDVPGAANEKGKQVIEKYISEYGNPMNDFVVVSQYDAVIIVADLLRACGEDTECMKDELHKMQVHGTMGDYRFKENGDVEGLKFVVKTIEDGKIKE